MTFSVLGAGLSGLSAAISLSKAGEQVIVYEKRSMVGRHTHPNMQGLLVHKPIYEYLSDLGLYPKNFASIKINHSIICTPKRDIYLNLREPIEIIQRGGDRSLESALYNYALDIGDINFKFSQTISKDKANIVATGPKKCDVVAFGLISDAVNLPSDTILYMHDDKISPQGGYLYILPLPNGEHEIVNCVSKVHASNVKHLLFKGLQERPILRKIIRGDLTFSSQFGGIGGCDFPKSAIINGTLYVGEAAGFQDPARGFGMDMALESGNLAASALCNNYYNYDRMWKSQFKERIKKRMSYRFLFSILGDLAAELAFNKYQTGDTINFNDIIKKDLASKIIMSLLSNSESAKYKITGNW